MGPLNLDSTHMNKSPPHDCLILRQDSYVCTDMVTNTGSREKSQQGVDG